MDQAKRVKDIYYEPNASSLLGSGLMPQTRLGIYQRDQNTKLEAVVKILQMEGGTSASTNQEQIYLYQFYRKLAKTTESLKHLNIVQSYSIAKTPSTYYFAFEYCKFNLLQLKESKPNFEEHEILAFLESMVEALDYIYQTGSIHGNLKPSNVYFSKRLPGDKILYKLGDFYGFKSMLHSENAMHQNILNRSLQHNLSDPFTKEFVAPEAVTQQKFSQKADVYSLGCICFWLLFQALPSKKDRVNQTTISRPLRNLIDLMLLQFEQRLSFIELKQQLQLILYSQQEDQSKTEIFKNTGEDIDQIKFILQKRQQLSQQRKNIERKRFIDLFVKGRIETPVQFMLQLRSRAQFYQLYSKQLEELARAIDIDPLIINSLILATNHASVKAYKDAQKYCQLDVEPFLSEIMIREYQQYLEYFNKVFLSFDQYIKEYEFASNCSLDVEVIQLFLNDCLKDNVPESRILYDVLGLMMREIIDRKVQKRVKLEEVTNPQLLCPLNLLLLCNKLEYFRMIDTQQRQIDYQAILQYAESLKQFDDLIVI